MRKFLAKDNSGFSLLEVMSAIFILTVGVGASISLIRQTISAGSAIEDRLIAAYLAQEGIEIVRNIRDSNWLQGRGEGTPPDFYDGLLCGTPPCDYEADYTTLTFSDTGFIDEGCNPGGYYNGLYYNCHTFNNTFLNIDTNGFYSYNTVDVQTKFIRKITINQPEADKISVLVEVTWQEKGENYSFKVLEYLSDWYNKYAP